MTPENGKPATVRPGSENLLALAGSTRRKITKRIAVGKSL
jgi:hypothetical protein